jgi:hypothetical protein
MENYAPYFNLAGVALIAVGCFFLLIRIFRHWRKGLLPLGLIGLGLVITAFPPVYRLLAPIDLGPRDKLVDGQRHITLTGWNGKDYGFLRSRRDVVVLQMANPDVTDNTLDNLKGMTALKELDLDNSRVTDAGLKVLKDLPELTSLRLKNTGISDHGFQQELGEKESLMHLDLTGTQVNSETVQTWKNAKKGRRAMR